MVNFAVVSASSAEYFPLLRGLLASLRQLGRIPVHVLDLGMSSEMLCELHDQGVTTTVPDWDIAPLPKKMISRFGRKVPIPDTFRAFTAQPFLPR